MLIPHQFVREGHTYRVKGEYVLSTSDVLSLNGLCLFEGVPTEVLKGASERGRMVHEVIQCLEEKVSLPRRTGEAQQRVQFYLRWKQRVGYVSLGPRERSIVYRHLGTETLIGGTPDDVGRIGDELWIVDFKTCFRQAGQAKKQKVFEWRLQTQSYLEGLSEDREMWERLGTSVQQVKRMVLHLHPDCGVEVRGGERLGWEEHRFEEEDSDLWNAVVTVATEKLKNGHKLPDRR